MHYYYHHIGDFNNGTVRMTQLERWLYRDMVEVYYDTEKPLPNSLDKVCAMIGARTPEQREAVATILINKFEETPEGWRHERCEEELATYRAKAEVARQNGKKGGRKKSDQEPIRNPVGSDPLPSSTPMESESQANQEPITTEPITNNQEPGNHKKKPKAAKPPIELPDWLDRQTWHSFVEHRKELRKPMSYRASQLAIAELEKLRDVGHDPTAVINQSIMRGWQGLFPVRDDSRQLSILPVSPANPHGLGKAGLATYEAAQQWLSQSTTIDETK